MVRARFEHGRQMVTTETLRKRCHPRLLRTDQHAAARSLILHLPQSLALVSRVGDAPWLDCELFALKSMAAAPR